MVANFATIMHRITFLKKGQMYHFYHCDVAIPYEIYVKCFPCYESNIYYQLNALSVDYLESAASKFTIAATDFHARFNKLPTTK